MNLSRIKNAQGGRNIGIHDLQRAVFNRRPPPSLRDNTARHRSSGRYKRSIGARWRYRHDIRYQLQKIMFRLPDISAAVTMARRVVPEITFLACNEQRVFERNSCHRELNCSLRSKACRSIRSARRRRQNDLLAATRRVFRFFSFRYGCNA